MKTTRTNARKERRYQKSTKEPLAKTKTLGLLRMPEGGSMIRVYLEDYSEKKALRCKTLRVADSAGR